MLVNAEYALNIMLLAAGKGTRFAASQGSANQRSGSQSLDKPSHIKQLTLINGVPLINHTLQPLQKACVAHEKNNEKNNGKESNKEKGTGKIYVILGAYHQQIAAVLPDNVTPLISEHYAQGMGHSIADSVQALAKCSSHIMIALGDQALINTQHYQALIAKSKAYPEKIIATISAKKVMAPVIFPRQYFSALQQLQGDKGAKALLRQFAQQLVSVSCPQAIIDIDTLNDLQQAFPIRPLTELI